MVRRREKKEERERRKFMTVTGLFHISRGTRAVGLVGHSNRWRTSWRWRRHSGHLSSAARPSRCLYDSSKGQCQPPPRSSERTLRWQRESDFSVELTGGGVLSRQNSRQG